MGKITKGVDCVVQECGSKAIKSISIEKVKKTNLKIKEGRKAYLCKDHYKEYKRQLKNDRKIEMWRIGKKGV